MAALAYRYTARTAHGTVVHGSMHAAAVGDVLEMLRARALFVTSVDRESDAIAKLRDRLSFGGTPASARLGFLRSFATLIRAGISIGRALEVTIERTADVRLSEALRSVLADVEHGAALSSALARRPREFLPLHVAMIHAGEAGGILEDVLERLAVMVEREAALSRKVISALAYPAVVLTAATLLVVFLIARIVPMFSELFDSFHVELPLTTRVLLSIGQDLQGPLPWILAIISLGIVAAIAAAAQRSARAALVLDDLRLRLPLVGSLMKKAIVARIARTLATLLRSGVDLVTAIREVLPVAGSARYARALAYVNVALENGESLMRPLEDTALFDPLFVALVGAGEETGLVDEMLLTVAQYYEADVEATIATLGAVIEPALIVGLGCVVGFIVFSIFIPLYSLIGSVSK